MKIGFFGHSAASWSNDPRSFIDILKNKLNAEIVSIGVPQGSEERILFNLKKTKAIDIAFVFHSTPNYLFLPRCKRDISLQAIPENKAKIFWSENRKDDITAEQFSNEFFSYGHIREVFSSEQEFAETIRSYKMFLNHQDLALNRFQSSLLMIDTFLFNKKIRAFHTIRQDVKPNWFSFSSGNEYPKIEEILKEYYAPGINPNNLTDAGNVVLAEYLLSILN